MKFFTLILFSLVSNSYLFSQTISIRVANLSEEKAILYSLSGKTSSLIDTVSTVNKGLFQFRLDQKHSGFYQLTISNNKRIDFIYDTEDVEITTDANNILDSIKIIKSVSNKIYYEFLKLNEAYKTKSELLQIILASYPEKDDYYQTTKDKLTQVQENYLYFANITSQINSNSLIARYVRSAQLFVAEDEVTFDQQLNYLKTHSMDKVNFYDDGLIYSDVFTNKAIEYLTYYRNPNLPLELLEKEFYPAIDTILNKAKVNEIVYTHIVEYLLDGFKQYGFDNVINYIVENYVIKDDLCLDQKLSNTLDRRIQQAKNFKSGNVVSNIILPDTSGFLIDLNKINSENTLIIFYASWCPHCQKLIPEIYDIYKKQQEKKFEVLAVSIDTLRAEWINYIRKNNLSWLNVSDLKGWDGITANDYFIYATPTMFLLDSKKKFIKLVSTPKELNHLGK